MTGEKPAAGLAETEAECREQARDAAVADLVRASGVLRVRGASMGPTLGESSWVRFSPRRPRRGDIVVYRRGVGDLVVHRFLGRRPRWWHRSEAVRPDDPWIVTKPDAAAEFDVEVRASAVLGVVDEVRPDSSTPWRQLAPSRLRRLLSGVWFGGYLLRRAVRRLTR